MGASEAVVPLVVVAAPVMAALAGMARRVVSLDPHAEEVAVAVAMVAGAAEEEAVQRGAHALWATGA